MAEESVRRITGAVAETARQFNTDDRRVAGTIWWYMNCGKYSFDEQHSVIEQLAKASGASPQALWAIASDDLAKHLLESGRRDVDVPPPLLKPRFVEVAGRWFVKRQSCCLIYETPCAGMCLSCPRHLPVERERLLSEFVGRSH